MIQSFMEVSQTVHGKAQNLQYAVLTDSPFQDKLDRLADEINPGETIQGAYPYEFINENKPVHFKFRDRLLSLDEPIASEEITITEKVWSASLASIGPNFFIFRWKRFSFYKTCVNVFALSKFSRIK